MLFDIDWQGTQQLQQKARADVVSVFILPPSAADLEKRLHSRAQDSDEVIRKRMSRASHEMSHWAEYDYIVINHDVDEAFAEVQSILKAERLKRERRIGLAGLRSRFARSASGLGRDSRGPSFTSRSSIVRDDVDVDRHPRSRACLHLIAGSSSRPVVGRELEACAASISNSRSNDPISAVVVRLDRGIGLLPCTPLARVDQHRSRGRSRRAWSLALRRLRTCGIEVDGLRRAARAARASRRATARGLRPDRCGSRSSQLAVRSAAWTRPRPPAKR